MATSCCKDTTRSGRRNARLARIQHSTSRTTRSEVLPATSHYAARVDGDHEEPYGVRRRSTRSWQHYRAAAYSPSGGEANACPPAGELAGHHPQPGFSQHAHAASPARCEVRPEQRSSSEVGCSHLHHQYGQPLSQTLAFSLSLKYTCRQLGLCLALCSVARRWAACPAHPLTPPRRATR